MATQGVTAIQKRRTLWQWLKGYTGQKYMTTALFLAIPVALLILFTIIPAVNMIIFSFQQRDQLGVNVQWVGFDNYKTLFTDMAYLSTLINSLYYFVGSFIQLGLALFIATLLCSKIKFAGLFKGVIFFPYLMNGVAVALIFQRFFRGDDGGTLNSIIALFGADPVKWLSNGAINNWCLVFASVWRYIGFDILMFIGAIQSISPDIYEAADLDGANAWQKFWHIIFPGIRTIIALQLILAIKGAASVFEIPYIITGGKMGTSTFVIKTIETGFQYQKIGLASAMAIVLLFIIILITMTDNITTTENSGQTSFNMDKYRFKETPKGVRILIDVLKYAVLVIACLIVIVPLVVVLLGSLKSHEDFLTSGAFELPKVVELANFKTAFLQGNVMRGLINTAIILVFSCAGTIITGTMTAFVVQRFTMVFTKLVKNIFLIAALLPNISMQVTVFQVVHALGLYDTLAAPIILYIGTDIVSIYIFIQFLNNISVSLDESAILDGCSYPRVYLSIILPMLRPAIATVLVIKFVSIYNDFYTANLYMPSDGLQVVSTALYKFIGPYGSQWEIIFAGVIICIIPTLIIFLSMQKFIYSNLVSGSVKE